MKWIIVFLSVTLIFELTAQSIDTISIFFDHDQSVPNQQNKIGKNQIKELNSTTHVVVKGYTDTSGTEHYNKQLALKRASNIRKLIELPDSQLVLMAIGETTIFGADEQNRRVLIIQELIAADTLVLDIQFKNREAVIVEKSYSELHKLIDTIKSGSYSRIEVHGHVCCNGNYQLSMDRARTVESDLVEAGVDANKIVCFGHSNKEPRYPEVNPENEARNRRVEVVLFE